MPFHRMIRKHPVILDEWELYMLRYQGAPIHGPILELSLQQLYTLALDSWQERVAREVMRRSLSQLGWIALRFRLLIV